MDDVKLQHIKMLNFEIQPSYAQRETKFYPRMLSFESFITFIETLSIESDCYPHTDAKPSLKETF